MMKALTLTEPWASLMFLLPPRQRKEVETRSWWTSHRGELVIHGAKGYPHYAQSFTERCIQRGWLPADYVPQRGVIHGTVSVVEVLHSEKIVIETSVLVHSADTRRITTLEAEFGNYEEGRYGFFTEQPRRLDAPIACKGFQRIWHVPPGIESAVRRQFAEMAR